MKYPITAEQISEETRKNLGCDSPDEEAVICGYIALMANKAYYSAFTGKIPAPAHYGFFIEAQLKSAFSVVAEDDNMLRIYLHHVAEIIADHCSNAALQGVSDGKQKMHVVY